MSMTEIPIRTAHAGTCGSSTWARSPPTGRSREFGDRGLIDDFRARVKARLLLLPPHDPQFRRNRERVIRDAERENLTLDWDLGLPEDD